LTSAQYTNAYGIVSFLEAKAIVSTRVGDMWKSVSHLLGEPGQKNIFQLRLRLTPFIPMNKEVMFFEISLLPRDNPCTYRLIDIK
jgi:hypothetical protein